MALEDIPIKSTEGTFSLFKLIIKYWYWIILIIVIIPSVITSINTAIHTQNPTYPLFQLGSRLFSADNEISNDVITLQTEPAKLIGMEHPASGAFNHVKFYWLVWWKVIFKTLGNIWLITFPLVLIYKIISAYHFSTASNNFIRAFIYFLLYLLFTNAIILAYNASVNDVKIIIPEGSDRFQGYFIFFINVLPFHGIVRLILYLIGLIT